MCKAVAPPKIPNKQGYIENENNPYKSADLPNLISPIDNTYKINRYLQ